MAKMKRVCRLPDGSKAKSVKQYADAWTELGAVLEDIGYKAFGFDPRISFVSGNTTVQLPVDIAMYIKSLKDAAAVQWRRDNA